MRRPAFGASFNQIWLPHDEAQLITEPNIVLSILYVLLSRFLSFFLYILPGTRFRALSAGVDCTLRVAGWKPTSNHIEITVGFFNLHRGWLSLHRGHPVNIPIRRTMHLSSVIPANDTRESVFGHQNFSRREWESNLGPLAPEASA